MACTQIDGLRSKDGLGTYLGRRIDRTSQLTGCERGEWS